MTNGSQRLLSSSRSQGTTEACLDAVKIVSRMIGVSQQSRQEGTLENVDYVLGGALGHKVLISKVKTLGMTFTSGCTLH
jgi:hypothetical protein